MLALALYLESSGSYVEYKEELNKDVLFKPMLDEFLDAAIKAPLRGLL